MCNLLVAATAIHAHGSARDVRAALTAQARDCESGFGKRGEFAGYAPLVRAAITRIRVRGDLATVRVSTNRGPGALHFLYLAGRWRMLVAGS